MNRDFPEQSPASWLSKLYIFLFGKPLSLDPRKQQETRKHTLLIAFLAWIGLGADGLSSACYGPETAFLALGQHTHLALYLAIATAFTVFIIALGYNQVIELFPSGGGGYKVATQLIGPYAGLTSGVALIVDYVLTISVSIASCVDALFSLLPMQAQGWKLTTEIILLCTLGILNLRGIKESIKILMPIFLAFFISHAFLIIYGTLKKTEPLSHLIPDTYQQTLHLGHELGWMVFLAFFLRAYSLGGGTYTGIEAVSNNVNRLVSPCVRTGKWTMWYMAFSLAFTAGGILLLYVLWQVTPVPGETLNASVFKSILQNWTAYGTDWGAGFLLLVMVAEGGLLFVAANTGYIDGPNVLANMAVDSWVPTRFRHLSSRLVTQNGVVLMGIGAGLILLWTRGQVQLLVIMYSINVFLTFSLSLLGLCIHWAKTKEERIEKRILRFCFSLVGLLVTSSILAITLIEKFEEGGWVTLGITMVLIFICMWIKKKYTRFNALMKSLDAVVKQEVLPEKFLEALPIDPQQATAIFFVGEHPSIGIYALKKVLSLFPNQYKNFIFLSVGNIDTEALRQEGDLQIMRAKVNRRLSYLVNFCRAKHLPSVHYQINDTDVIEGLTRLAKQKSHLYPNCVFFAGTTIFERDNWINHWLHNHTATLVQQRLQSEGLYMMLLPIGLADFQAAV